MKKAEIWTVVISVCIAFIIAVVNGWLIGLICLIILLAIDYATIKFHRNKH